MLKTTDGRKTTYRLSKRDIIDRFAAEQERGTGKVFHGAHYEATVDFEGEECVIVVTETRPEKAAALSFRDARPRGNLIVLRDGVAVGEIVPVRNDLCEGFRYVASDRVFFGAVLDSIDAVKRSLEAES